MSLPTSENLPAPDESPPRRCPRHAKKGEAAPPATVRAWVSFAELHREPFRVFFPVACLAGLIGVALWPLMLGGWMTDYPGLRHARLMTQGFFGGFIFGFLGTSIPRFIEAPPLAARETFSLLALFVGNIVAHTFGADGIGDTLFAIEIVLLLALLRRRCCAAQDSPPPGFSLMPMAFLCALAGILIERAGRGSEAHPSLELLGRLLGYHGFVLLCIMGAGGFLLPRFLGIGARRSYASGATPSPEWKRTAWVARGCGASIILTYVLEAAGWPGLAGTLRAGVAAGYFWREMPMERLRWSWKGVDWILQLGLVCIPLGILAAGWLPAWRVAFSHLELVGGFALITFGVGARVVHGHSGMRAQLERFHGGLTAAAAFMIVGMLSRVAADFGAQLQMTHYLYGALCWAAGLLMWGGYVLPKVLQPDNEE